MLPGLAICLAATPSARTPTSPPIRIEANHVIELTAESSRDYVDPFNELMADAHITGPEGRTVNLPAYWSGGKRWSARFASPKPGRYSYGFTCSNKDDVGFARSSGTFEVIPYRGRNPLYKHGPVQVAANRRHFEHADGTPFFWLGDTWWMGLCKPLAWPDDFRALLKDRAKKGYTVVQVVAGLYPDMPAFDERGANEAGFPWTEGYGRIRPEYFDKADRRIQALVDAGITPCIVGAWGYFIPWMGHEKLEKHWRYIVARYGAYPVFWCVAGEANLPYYLTPGFPFDDRAQVKEWTKVAGSLRKQDPFRRPISIHPTGLGKLDARHAIDDVGLLDFDMLQTGHGDRSSLPPTVDASRAAWKARPKMPWLNSEVCYEGILGACHDDVQRLMFWTSMLNGAAGHTYGANGIWQLNQPGTPYGKSPHGGDYGPVPWTEAMNLPGSGQLGRAKTFLERFEWWKLTPAQDAARYASDSGQAVWGDWIWYPEGKPAEDAPVAPRWFRRTFALASSKSVVRATLRVAADDRHAAWVNGKPVGDGAGWSSVRDVDVTRHLSPGVNVIAIRAENMKAPVEKNPAGLLCALSIQHADGRTQHIVSDSAWKASNVEEAGWDRASYSDANWQKAMKVAEYGSRPWGRIADPGPYLAPYVAGLPDGTRIAYVPLARPISMKLDSGKRYRIEVVDPITCKVLSTVDSAGGVVEAGPPTVGDWILVARPAK